MTIQEVDERIDMKLGMLLEAIDNKFAQFIELIQSQNEQVLNTQNDHSSRFDRLQTDTSILKTDIEIVKVTLKDTNHDVRELKQRVTNIEKIIEHKYE